MTNSIKPNAVWKKVNNVIWSLILVAIMPAGAFFISHYVMADDLKEVEVQVEKNVEEIVALKEAIKTVETKIGGLATQSTSNQTALLRELNMLHDSIAELRDE